MLRIDQIRINTDRLKGQDESLVLCKKLAAELNTEVKELKIIKRSLDARHKPDILYVYSVAVKVENEKKALNSRLKKNITSYIPPRYEYRDLSDADVCRPVIVGMGPAGLFCGYALARMGLKPVLIERGHSVDDRKNDVEEFWRTGHLNTESNVQFGEGGAGTFSDGKLNTLNKDIGGRNTEALRIFVENGASPSILYDNKPHIGTDQLINIVANIRERIISLGGQVRFNTRLSDITIADGQVKSITVNDSEIIDTDRVILAIGHSARDTFYRLNDLGVPMEAKPFAVGLRVQHPQDSIDYNQYGRYIEDDILPVASYKLVNRNSSKGRNCYSFCMCPGGYVVNASSEPERTAVNGMSYSDRASGTANSAIIVSVSPEDYPNASPLGGVEFQRELEHRAYVAGKGAIPVQFLGDYRSELTDYVCKLPDINDYSRYGHFRGQTSYASLKDLFPEDIARAFLDGMDNFGHMIEGFNNDDVLLAGVESRTSSPVRIVRDGCGQSAVKGLYPCGEGAGYAGGITSAAMDGLYIAECISKEID